MSEKRQFSDEELVSFLDGECSGELATDISLALEADPELQARMAGLDLNMEELRAGLDSLLQAAPKPDIPGEESTEDPPLVQDNKKSGFSMRPFLQIAALLLAGVIGYSVTFLQPSTVPQPQKPGWIQMVVNYQQLYSKKTLELITPSPAQARETLAAVSKELGVAINYDTATSRDDITLKKTQLLSFNGKPLVQMAYLSKTGTPLALCIIRSNKPGDAPPKYLEKSNMHMSVWRKGGYAYLLIGGQDKALIETLTKDMSVKL